VNGALKLDLSSRVFAVALLAFAVVVAGAGWFAVIAPKHDKAATLQTAIQSDQTRLAVALHAQQQAQSARKGEGKALEAALPDQLAMPAIVDQLNAMAVKAGVTLDTVTPGAVVTGNGYIAVPITVVVDGHFFSVEKFLKLVRTRVSLGSPGKSKLSASGRLFGVASMQISQTEPAPTVTATFNMSAYYYSRTATVPLPAATTTTSDTTG
jgi:Pilus assembly protein, PilO